MEPESTWDQCIRLTGPCNRLGKQSLTVIVILHALADPAPKRRGEGNMAGVDPTLCRRMIWLSADESRLASSDHLEDYSAQLGKWPLQKLKSDPPEVTDPDHLTTGFRRSLTNLSRLERTSMSCA